MLAAIIEECGSPEVLKIKDIPIKKLKAGEVRVRHTALGLNYIDVALRRGDYKVKLPAILGFEACGVIEKITPEAVDSEKDFKIGDRVAYATAGNGAYCELRNIRSDFLVKIPDKITDEQAAAILFKGMTAHYLLRRSFFVRPGMYILVYAASGGVGHFLVQMAKFYKAIVIGVVGSKDKVKLAEIIGCDYVINYAEQDIAKEVNNITDGQGVHVVYDSVGKDTFLDSLNSLGLFGLMVSFGQSSGEVPAFDIRRLTEKSLFITRPSLFVYKGNYSELKLSAEEIFQMHINKVISDNINQRFHFDNIVSAHRAIESRKTIGSSIIMF